MKRKGNVGMKISLLALALWVTAGIWLLEAPGAQAVSHHQIDFNLGLGSATTESEQNYSWDWSWYSLSHARETGSVSCEKGIGLSAGVGYTFFFNELIGIGCKIDYERYSFDTKMNYDVYWRWSDGRAYEEYVSDTGSGDITEVAPGFDVVFRFGDTNAVTPVLRFGPSLFMTNVSADAWIGAAYSARDGYYQYFDYFTVDSEINEDITTVGAHLDFNLNINFNKTIALNIETGYYYSPTAEVEWQFKPGVYYGYNGALRLNLDSGDAKELTDSFSDDQGKMEVDPSFYKVAVGLAFNL